MFCRLDKLQGNKLNIRLPALPQSGYGRDGPRFLMIRGAGRDRFIFGRAIFVLFRAETQISSCNYGKTVIWCTFENDLSIGHP